MEVITDVCAWLSYLPTSWARAFVCDAVCRRWFCLLSFSFVSLRSILSPGCCSSVTGNGVASETREFGEWIHRWNANVEGGEGGSSRCVCDRHLPHPHSLLPVSDAHYAPARLASHQTPSGCCTFHDCLEKCMTLFFLCFLFRSLWPRFTHVNFSFWNSFL